MQAFGSNCDSDEKSEIARGLLLEISDKKIQQHFTLLFAAIGAFFAIFQVLEYLKITLSHNWVIIIGLMFLNGFVYIIGRGMYWVRLNSILFRVKPCKLFMRIHNQNENYIFSLYNAARFYIKYISENSLVKFFSSSYYALIYLGAFSLGEIIGFIMRV